jgi:choline dehydrogenase
MRWDFFVKYHDDDAVTRQFTHLTWRTIDGGFYIGTDPPAGAELLGVYYPRAGTLGGCSTHNLTSLFLRNFVYIIFCQLRNASAHEPTGTMCSSPK